VAFAVLAALGYFFTAIIFTEHLLLSMVAILAVSVIHGLAVRWLILGERRLALKRAEYQRILGTGSLDDLIKELEAQTARLEKP